MATNMTKEKVLERETTATSRSTLPEEVKEILREGKIAVEKSRQRFENLKPLCPIDRTPGKFVRYEGAYTRVHGIFRCESEHEFNYSSRAQPQQK